MNYPVLIYDNLCSSCTEFAKKINVLSRGNITMLGHYTQVGAEFKRTIFPDDYEGLEMSWFVTDDKAFGGRAGLAQLIKYLLKNTIARNRLRYEENKFDLTACTTDCKTVKGVAIRSCSIITKSKRIEYAKD